MHQQKAEPFILSPEIKEEIDAILRARLELATAEEIAHSRFLPGIVLQPVQGLRIGRLNAREYARKTAHATARDRHKAFAVHPVCRALGVLAEGSYAIKNLESGIRILGFNEHHVIPICFTGSYRGDINHRSNLIYIRNYSEPDLDFHSALHVILDSQVSRNAGSPTYIPQSVFPIYPPVRSFFKEQEKAYRWISKIDPTLLETLTDQDKNILDAYIERIYAYSQAIHYKAPTVPALLQHSVYFYRLYRNSRHTAEKSHTPDRYAHRKAMQAAEAYCLHSLLPTKAIFNGRSVEDLEGYERYASMRMPVAPRDWQPYKYLIANRSVQPPQQSMAPLIEATLATPSLLSNPNAANLFAATPNRKIRL